jgi:hypothetical protein
MTFYYYFIGASALLVLGGLTVAWSRKDRWVRWCVIGCTLLIIPAAYMSMMDLLSRPKPESKEHMLHNVPIVEVLGFYVKEDIALYILLFNEEWDEPRYYVYAWSPQIQQMVNKLRQGWEQAQEDGENVYMHRPFDPTVAPSERFNHPDPPQTNRPKHLEEGITQEYDVE